MLPDHPSARVDGDNLSNRPSGDLARAAVSPLGSCRRPPRPVRSDRRCERGNEKPPPAARVYADPEGLESAERIGERVRPVC